MRSKRAAQDATNTVWIRSQRTPSRLVSGPANRANRGHSKLRAVHPQVSTQAMARRSRHVRADFAPSCAKIRARVRFETRQSLPSG